MNGRISVIRINDSEWVAGEGTPVQILEAYMEKTGLSLEECTGEDPDYPELLTEEQMAVHKFTHDDDEHPLDNPISFREKLDQMIAEGVQFPTHFATTDW
jgi:hypothetical protein